MQQCEGALPGDSAPRNAAISVSVRGGLPKAGKSASSWLRSGCSAADKLIFRSSNVTSASSVNRPIRRENTVIQGNNSVHVAWKDHAGRVYWGAGKPVCDMPMQTKDTASRNLSVLLSLLTAERRAAGSTTWIY
jgi:hypothetical protein